MGEWVVGVDLGGTKIEVGLVSPQNEIIGRRRIPTRPVEGPQKVVTRIVEEVHALQSLLPPGESVAALGICSPGPVDHETGTLIDPPNLAGLHNAPLRQMLSDALHIPVSLEHDAKATGLGEFYYGAGRGEQSMVYIIVGTGVGAAVITDGQLLRGKNNAAGEIGHVALDRYGEVCSCGSRGCVETYMSGPWLAWRYQQAEEKKNGQALSEPVTGERVAALAEQGDPTAREIMTLAGESLGIAVATMAMVLDIDLFVVGGSVVKSGDLLLEPARRMIPQHSYRSVGCGIRLVATEIADDAPILGCAWLAREAARAHAGEPAANLEVTPASQPGGADSERTMLEKVEGIVFDIQRFSVHDGPGVRTNIFLKGCSLRCDWCANPESQRPHPEIAFSEQRCIACGQFEETCGYGWLTGAETLAARDKYSQRTSLCPTGGIHWIGERRTAGQVMEEIRRDRPFYQQGGGVTLTGGEPTFQPRMAEALLRLAKAEGINTALETSGHTRWKVFERLLPYLDHIMFDIKHMDGEKHRQHTGIDNTLILANLRKLASLGAPVEIRVPLIPGFNADMDSVQAIADFVMQVEGLEKKICLLPYHTFGRSKYKSLGRAYPWEAYARLDGDEIDAFVQHIASRGPGVVVGG